MKLDVTENDKEYLVKAEIPGAKKEDIHVSIEGNYVSISAEVKEEKKETRKGDGERVLLQELRYGSFSRGFTLPQGVDAKVKARPCLRARPLQAAADSTPASDLAQAPRGMPA